MDPIKKGVFFAVASYVSWGLLPLYWHLLNFTSPFHILGSRIVFSLVFTALVLFASGNTRWIRLLTEKRSRLYTIGMGFVLALNWGLYIQAVNTGHTIDASLGYYINPLVVVVLGLIFLGEKLTVLQWIAFGLASLGVVLLTVFSGVFPWIALLLALSFGLYGLIKKKSSGGVLEALGAETLAAFPLGLALLFFTPYPAPDTAALALLSFRQWALLVSTGVITAIPLLTFARGAKLLPLATVGFLQFIQPTILFFMSVFAFGEPFPLRNLWAFGCIWAAVVLYCLSLRKKYKIHHER